MGKVFCFIKPRKIVFLFKLKDFMEFLDRYQQIVADAITKYTFKDKPSELYDPMNYIISHGGKRLRPIMVLMACEMFGGDLKQAI